MLKKPEDFQIKSMDSEESAGNSEDFYRRWSRRKQTHRDRPSKSIAEPTDVASDQMDAPPEATDADMPPIDSLGEESDFSGFMSPKVSEKLRKVALRKLFNLPQFNLRDGLDDYDDDFTKFEALGDIITADLRHQMEMEAERNKAKENQLAELEPEGVELEDADLSESETDEARMDPIPDPSATPGAGDDIIDEHMPAGRIEDESSRNT